MEMMTLGEIDERITELDALIFRAETGQVAMSWQELEAHVVEADVLMNVLAENIAEKTGCTYEEANGPREKLRIVTRMKTVLGRHIELHPEELDRVDPEIQEAFATGDVEIFKRIMDRYKYLFVNCPRPPTTHMLKTILSRWFKRS
jgi:hypothetical protein